MTTDERIKKGYVSEAVKKLNPGLFRANPPARVRAEKPKPNGRGEGENPRVEKVETGIQYRVTIIVRRRRLLDEGDNDRAALKPLRDAIAESLELPNDQPPGIVFDYHQIQSKGRSTTILIETLTTNTTKEI